MTEEGRKKFERARSDTTTIVSIIFWMIMIGIGVTLAVREAWTPPARGIGCPVDKSKWAGRGCSGSTAD
jgi:hypothetical protein